MQRGGPDRGSGDRPEDEWLDGVDWLDSGVAREQLPPPPRESDSESQTQIVHVARPDVQRRRMVAGVVVLLLLGAGIAGPLIAFRGGPSSAPPATTPAATTTTQTATTTTAATTTTPAATTSAPVQLPSTGTMRRGETDTAAVRKLQQALIALGYKNVTADGIFGPGTQAAVAEFQAAKGLPNDGIVGQATADALNAAVAAKTG